MRTSVKLGAPRDAGALETVPEGGAVGFPIEIPGCRHLFSAEEARTGIERLPSGVEAWAVVVSPTAELIHRLYDEVGVDRIQVYGTVPAGLEFLEIHHLVPSLPIPVAGSEGEPPVVPPAEDYPRLHLDAVGEPYLTGSPDRPDWERCAAIVDRHPGRKFTLAGGLTPENVAEALATVRPWGVDVTAGVERTPGEFDPARWAAFLRAIESFEGSGNPPS